MKHSMVTFILFLPRYYNIIPSVIVRNETLILHYFIVMKQL